MNIRLNEEKELYAKLVKINSSTYDSVSIQLKGLNNEEIIARIDKEINLEIGELYFIKVIGKEFKERVVPFITSIVPLSKSGLSLDERLEISENLSDGVRIDIDEFISVIENTLNGVVNKIIREIGLSIYNEYKGQFIVYPAATKFHHAYKHGLLFHTYSMLEIAKAVCAQYKHINTDLVYVSVILHDLLKIKEINNETNEYTVEGKLIGHLSLCLLEVSKHAERLGYKDTEEVMLLEHVIIAHHGEGEFGSPKRPQIIEALVVHLIDMMDAKIEPTVEALSRIDVGSYTEQIYVNDRDKFYKHKLSK